MLVSGLWRWFSYIEKKNFWTILTHILFLTPYCVNPKLSRRIMEERTDGIIAEKVSGLSGNERQGVEEVYDQELWESSIVSL